MNAKLIKVAKRLVPLTTAIVATALVMNKVKSGLNENSTDFEVRATRATAAILGGLTFGAVATLTSDILEDLTAEEIKNAVNEIADEIK